MGICVVFFFKQKTAYEMRISDWSSDVCSSDLCPPARCASSPSARGWAACRSPGPAGPADGERRGSDRPSCRAYACVWIDRKSVGWGKSVSVRVDLGGRRFIKKQKQRLILAHI